MWLHFTRHRLAMMGLWVIVALYAVTLLHGFVAPYDKATRSPFIFRPPQALHFSDGEGFSLRPFVYGTAIQRDLATMSRTFVDDPAARITSSSSSRATRIVCSASSRPTSICSAWSRAAHCS